MRTFRNLLLITVDVVAVLWTVFAIIVSTFTSFYLGQENVPLLEKLVGVYIYVVPTLAWLGYRAHTQNSRIGWIVFGVLTVTIVGDLVISIFYAL